MKKFKEHKTLNLPQIDEEILKFWKAEKVFEKSISEREGSPQFVFYEGPPSANGMPGIHHVMARAIKDLFCRYKTLKVFTAIYVIFSPTANALLAGNVHGVVVHASK